MITKTTKTKKLQTEMNPLVNAILLKGSKGLDAILEDLTWYERSPSHTELYQAISKIPDKVSTKVKEEFCTYLAPIQIAQAGLLQYALGEKQKGISATLKNKVCDEGPYSLKLTEIEQGTLFEMIKQLYQLNQAENAKKVRNKFSEYGKVSEKNNYYAYIKDEEILAAEIKSDIEKTGRHGDWGVDKASNLNYLAILLIKAGKKNHAIPLISDAALNYTIDRNMDNALEYLESKEIKEVLDEKSTAQICERIIDHRLGDLKHRAQYRFLKNGSEYQMAMKCGPAYKIEAHLAAEEYDKALEVARDVKDLTPLRQIYSSYDHMSDFVKLRAERLANSK